MSAPRPRLRPTAERRRDLERVARAAAKADKARADLDAAMLAASEAGHALRPIAAAARLSVEWTRRRIAQAAS